MRCKKVRSCGQNLSCFSRGRSRKKGVIGEGVLMIYRLVLVSFIALIILGLSTVFYDHYIDVRDVEARIVARNVVDCLSPVFEVEEIPEDVLIYCGYDEQEIERFFVDVDVIDSSDKLLFEMSSGDSGKAWVRELFEGDFELAEGIGKYKPGYFKGEYSSFILIDDEKIEGSIKVEVLVSDEF